MQIEQKPICIVIDTNMWISDSNLLLKTPLGAGLLYILKRINGYIGLPEIIEDEVIKHTIRVGNEAIQKINSNFKTLEILMGSKPSYNVPDSIKLETLARERFEELNHLLIRVPFLLEHAKSALRRVNEGSPPNGDKNQQFKDSAIWEAVLILSQEYTVHFITNDNGFFKDRKADSPKLADNLLDDCRKAGGNVHLYKDIKSCLQVLQKNVPSIDYQSLIITIDGVINPNFKRERVSDTGFEIISLLVDKSSVSAFLTEITGTLALTFEINYTCADIRGFGDNERQNAIFLAAGDCLYKPEDNSIFNLKMDYEKITWLEPSGELGNKGIVYLRSTIGGNDEINYTFRKPLQS